MVESGIVQQDNQFNERINVKTFCDLGSSMTLYFDDIKHFMLRLNVLLLEINKQDTTMGSRRNFLEKLTVSAVGLPLLYHSNPLFAGSGCNHRPGATVVAVAHDN